MEAVAEVKAEVAAAVETKVAYKILFEDNEEESREYATRRAVLNGISRLKSWAETENPLGGPVEFHPPSKVVIQTWMVAKSEEMGVEEFLAMVRDSKKSEKAKKIRAKIAKLNAELDALR